MSNKGHKTVSIIGLGWFGHPLALNLKSQMNILGTTRTQEKHKQFSEEGIQTEILTEDKIPSEKLLSSDVIVLNIPPFKDQLSWFKTWPWTKHAHVIFISSTSIYGELEGEVNESTVPSPQSHNAIELLRTEEFVQTFPHYTIIRFGGLIGPDRHPGRSLSGRKNISGGNQPVNLISLNDTINFTRVVIERKLTNDIFNLVHPDHPSRRDYYQNWCKNHQLPVPEFDDTPSPGKIISHAKVSRLYQFESTSLP